MAELTSVLTLLQHVTAGADAQKNFLVVDSKTDNAAIESAFEKFTEDRKDIGIVLINQHVRLDLMPDYQRSDCLIRS